MYHVSICHRLISCVVKGIRFSYSAITSVLENVVIKCKQYVAISKQTLIQIASFNCSFCKENIAKRSNLFCRYPHCCT